MGTKHDLSLLLSDPGPLPTKTLAALGMASTTNTLAKAAAAVAPTGPADAPEVAAFLARLTALGEDQRKVAAHLLARMKHDRLILAAIAANLAPMDARTLVRVAATGVPSPEGARHGWRPTFEGVGSALWRLATALGEEATVFAQQGTLNQEGLAVRLKSIVLLHFVWFCLLGVWWDVGVSQA